MLEKTPYLLEQQNLVAAVSNISNAFGMSALIIESDGTMVHDYINPSEYVKRYKPETFTRKLIQECLEYSQKNLLLHEGHTHLIYTNQFGSSFIILQIEPDAEKQFYLIFGPIRVEEYCFTESAYQEIADHHGWNFDEYITILNKLPFFTEKRLEHTVQMIYQVISQFQFSTDPVYQSQRLTRLEDRIKNFFDYLPDGMILFNRKDGKIIDVNETVLRMLGYSREELIQLNIQSLYANPDMIWNTDSILSIITKDQIKKIDIRWKHYDGKDVFAETYFTFLSKSETHTLIAILKDITMRVAFDQKIKQEKTSLEQMVEDRTKELLELNIKLRSYNSLLKNKNQKIREANMIKDIFLANISHELRTPLNSVIGFSQLLKMRLQSEADLEKIHRILGSAEHLLTLINELLELSEMASGKFSMEQTETDITHLFGDVLHLLEIPIRHKSLNIFQEIDPACQIIIVDRFRLKQILYNLLSNAVKYSNNDGSIYVRTKLVQEEKFIQFEVQDQGIGIEEDDQERIFVEFYQTEPTLTKENEGLGIGLALTKRLLDLMGGQIWVDSEIDQGACFYFTIPKILTPDNTLQSNELYSSGKTSERGGKGQYRILIVEDTPSNLHLMEEILAEMGNIIIYSAEDGQTAIKNAQERLLDLIFIDIRLNHEDGLDIVRSLKQNPKTKHIPIIALTAYIVPDIDKKALSAGCSHFVPKPINDLNEFYDIIKSYLE